MEGPCTSNIFVIVNFHFRCRVHSLPSFFYVNQKCDYAIDQIRIQRHDIYAERGKGSSTSMKIIEDGKKERSDGVSTCKKKTLISKSLISKV